MPRSLKIVAALRGILARKYENVGAAPSSVLLAVSGGADSLTLLDASAAIAPELGLRLEVASVDHGLRPESALEVAGVRRVAERLGLPFHALSVNVPKGPGLEARARALRYAAVDQARRARGLTFLATAHTASDQAETLLMRLGRGSGLGGAASVRTRRGSILRPMLQVTREEVEAYVEARGLDPVADPMNDDEAFTRVRVRKGALPALVGALGPQTLRALARFAHFADEDDALLGDWAQAAAERLTVAAGGLDAVGLRALEGPLRRRVLARLVQSKGLRVDAAMLERMEVALRRGGTCSLAGRADFHTQGGQARIEQAGGPGSEGGLPTKGKEVRLEQGGPAVTVGDYTLRWTATLPKPPSPGASTQPLLSAPEGGAVTVRFRRPGDVVRLPGGRTRKLQDVFVDAKVPAERRDEVPLLADARARILCVVGVWPHRGVAVSGFIVSTLDRRAGGRRGDGL